MSKNLNSKLLHVEGMTCNACEAGLTSELKKIKGIENVRVSFSKGTVEYTESDGKFHGQNIESIIEKLGYTVVEEKDKSVERSFTSIQFIGMVIIIIAIYVLIKNTVGFNFIPEVNPSFGYLALLVVGLVTSLHCVAMCGGINISQCIVKPDDSAGYARLKPSAMYNIGRVISYTIIGGLAGALGSAVSFSGSAKGIVAIASGIFMVIMGLNLFGTFPWIKKITPRLPDFLRVKKSVASKGKTPLVVGLLNGLMPCGPLQAMQIYALGTGSFIAGSLSMFFFSIGTVPLMFGLGIFSSMMSSRFNKKMMQTGAVLVMALGLVMMGRGMALSGVGFHTSPPTPGVSNSGIISTTENGIQAVVTNLSSNEYPEITVKKGIPVRWNMKAEASNINGCNGTIIIPKFNIVKKLEPGDNIIEFTPVESGSIPYSCGMGMIQSTINIMDGSKGGVQTPSKDASGNQPSGGVGGGGCCIDGGTNAK